MGPRAQGVLRHPKNTRLDTERPEPGQQEKSQPPWSNQTSKRSSRGLQSLGRILRAFPSWTVGKQTEGPQGSDSGEGVGLLGVLWVSLPWEICGGGKAPGGPSTSGLSPPGISEPSASGATSSPEGRIFAPFDADLVYFPLWDTEKRYQFLG